MKQCWHQYEKKFDEEKGQIKSKWLCKLCAHLIEGKYELAPKEDLFRGR